MAQNEKGQEIPDPTPVEVPVEFRRSQGDDLHAKIQRYITSELFKIKAEQEGFDTEEEANDFEVDDEEGADLPISYAERAVLMAEELESKKKEILDMEGKLRYNKNTVNKDRGDKDERNVGEGVETESEDEEGEGRVDRVKGESFKAGKA